MNYLIYVDGGCSDNGHRDKAKAYGSFAVYVLEEDETVNDALHQRLQTHEPLHHESHFVIIPPKDKFPTNNIAEAQSLATALVWCRDTGLFKIGNTVHICMDSELILNQFSGFYRVRQSTLRTIYQQIYTMLEEYGKTRGYNVEALLNLHWISGEVMKKSVIGH